MTTLIRTLHPEIKVLDERKGLVEYVASDETLDHDREVIRAKGWRFDYFKRYSPFLDSHRRDSVGAVLGKVVDFAVKSGRLIETVQWAIDAGLPDDHLANVGFRLTAGGYLKAVSVGFQVVQVVTAYDDVTAYREQLRQLGMDKLSDNEKPTRIFTEQQQTELSAVILGANPNALARAQKDGALSDTALGKLFSEEQRTVIKRASQSLCAGTNSRVPFPEATPAALAEARAKSRARQRFLQDMERISSRPVSNLDTLDSL